MVTITSNVKLNYKERDEKFKKALSLLKLKVFLNWLELFLIWAISSFIICGILHYMGITTYMALGISFLLSSSITYSILINRKYHLIINRFDKENLYQEINSELLSNKVTEMKK